MHHKPFGGRAPPGPAGGAYSVLQNLDYRDGAPGKGKGARKRGGEEKGKAGEKGEGRRESGW